MAAMGFDRVSALMERFTYKPSFTFTVFQTNNLGARVGIRIDMDVPDSTGGDNPVWGGFFVPPELTEDGFWNWMRDTVIGYIENHEADEWFKVDGVQFRPPHGPNQPERPWGAF